MQNIQSVTKETRSKSAEPTRYASKDAPKIHFCVDDRFPAPAHIKAVDRIARAVGGRLHFVRTVDTIRRDRGPADPVEWDIFRRQVLSDLHSLVDDTEENSNRVCRLAEGNRRSQLLACISPNRRDILAAVRYDPEISGLDHLPSALISGYDYTTLILPEKLSEGSQDDALKILVPLDGSPKAESALTTALRLCAHDPVELLLLHSVRIPKAATGLKLPEELLRKQSQATKGLKSYASQYLSKLQERLSSCGLSTRIEITETDDERRDILAHAEKHDADLVVLSAKGCGDHDDVSLGDVARFIVENSSIPVLLARNPYERRNKDSSRLQQTEARRPAGHLQ